MYHDANASQTAVPAHTVHGGVQWLGNSNYGQVVTGVASPNSVLAILMRKF